MKKLINNILILSFITLFIASCEDVATNVKIPATEKKIVVQCFISPDDDTINAMVSWSKPVIGTSYSSTPDFITNASVIISDENSTASLSWNSKTSLYTISAKKFKIEAGKKYFLKVELPDGKKVTASCYTPYSPNKTLVINKIDSTKNSWGERIYNCVFNYKDHEDSRYNYYRISCELLSDYPENNDYVMGDFKNNSEINEDNIYKISLYDFYGSSNSLFVSAYLISSDYNYFQYHKTLQNAQMNFGVFTEPSIVFTNIDGGLGCFGAYYSYHVKLKLY